MIAEKGVRAEGNVVDAHQVSDVLKVLHVRFDGVLRVILRQRGMRRRFDADDAALLGAGHEYPVGFHPVGVPQPAGANVGDDGRLFATFDHAGRCLVAAVSGIYGHAQFVHPPYHLAAKLAQSPVVGLSQPRTQGVGLRIGDAHGADAQSVEDVDAV